MTQTQAGWHPAPDRPGEMRYWDGAQWTDQYAPAANAPATPTTAYLAAAPAKKSHTLRNVLLVLGLLLFLFVGGCFAVVGLAANEVDNAIEESVKEDAAPGGPDNPLEVTVGEAFAVRDFNYQEGWSIAGNSFTWEVKGLRVENNRDEKDSAFIEIKLWKGQEVLALADCTTEPITPGTITALSCFSGDKLPKGYDRITVNDTF